MKKYIIISCLLIFISHGLFAEMVNISLGGQLGFAPELGGSLHSKKHEELGVYDGVYGINKLQSGKETKKIDTLLGASAGFCFGMIIKDYYFIRAGLNYTMNVWGGNGKALDNTANENVLNVKYSIWLIDLPVTAGISIPFWYDARVSLSGGLAFVYAYMKNSLESSEFSSSATFKGFGYPLVLILTGEYFILKDVVLTASFVYYKGATDVMRSGNDYAKVDLTGYRIYLGASYYFDYKIKFRKPDKEILENL